MSPGTVSVDPACEWSGNTRTVIGTTRKVIGTGYANTSAIIAKRNGGNTAGNAATVARAFQGGGKTDWSLPSKAELNALCKWAHNDTVNAICNNGGGYNPGRLSLTNGGFYPNYYLSSSESPFGNVWYQYFAGGYQSPIGKQFAFYVRPVRAF